jgi:2-C-methyl-D-erythritol 4-phosphate cytidylyltransferase/2-C-methyl-D-erythritol 2,4-cyclodiphosphate synthase
MHALVDAILGCLGRGDIGDLFPDSEEKYEDLSSAVFLSEVLLMAQKENLELQHIDMTVVAQVPRITPFKDQIRSNLAGLTGLKPEQINVKATTEEKLGFTGSRQGIKAMAMVTGIKHYK